MLLSIPLLSYNQKNKELLDRQTEEDLASLSGCPNPVD
jgi:hypothetical protein